VRRALLLLAFSGCNLLHGPQKAGECRGNLRTVLGGEQALFSEAHRYTTHPGEIGFAPTPGNRYLYLLAPEGPVSRRDGTPSPPVHESVGIGPDTRSRGVTAEWLRARFPDELLPQLGIHGTCPDCSFVAGCVGNLDDDEQVDVWTISSVDRPLPDGGVMLRGNPWHHLDDLH
jgi:hypothetical protein